MPQSIWALLLVVAAFAASTAGATDVLSPSPSLLTHSVLKNKDRPQKEQLIRNFEKQLLSMFGLSSRPRPRRNVTVSDYMWELYRKQDKLNRGLFGRPTNTIRCFRIQENGDSDVHKASFKFDIGAIPKHESVWAAELVVYRRKTNSKQSNPLHRVQVFDVLRTDSSTNSGNHVLRLLDTRVLRDGHAHDSGWETFDVLPTVTRWRKRPSKNHGLVVEILTNSTRGDHQHVRLKREARESHEEWLEFQPMLVTYSRDLSTGSKRTRRNARKHHRRKGRKNNCQRHALYVDFSDVGWNDWIVAPPGYDAYFCHGDCPFPLADHLNATNHAIVQTLVNSVNPAAVPRACCVPTELSPISMLYVDEYDKVVLKNYQDMVVEGCGCR